LKEQCEQMLPMSSFSHDIPPSSKSIISYKPVVTAPVSQRHQCLPSGRMLDTVECIVDQVIALLEASQDDCSFGIFPLLHVGLCNQTGHLPAF
jgi:hypothetical protein